ncbi:MAG: carboxypeptidase regulatory-like domain-containing protein [Gemmatimonadota bacterium]|nr:carboxypeptidase regulatory-like domain-containing protein [Gemmatimonadota bacterium]
MRRTASVSGAARGARPTTPPGALLRRGAAAALLLFGAALPLQGQGVTTGTVGGIVTDQTGAPLVGAVVTARHLPSGTEYQSVTRAGGVYTIPGMRVGGPYRVTARFLGYGEQERQNIQVSLGQEERIDFLLAQEAIELEAISVEAQRDDILNANRTGAETVIDPATVAAQPSVKRSTRDLIKIDPRNDGNFAFAGRNWLFNNITLDGSYFNNPFGLDDPAPGGQTAAEPVPFDAVEQVYVAIAPFDVRQGGFTGASVNTVTKSGTNEWAGTVYSFFRNEGLQGDEIDGRQVIADPDLTFNQTGFSLGGPLLRDKLFVFVNGEIERRDDPGTNFVPRVGGAPAAFGESRVQQSVLDAISERMLTEYGYVTGPFAGFVHETDNDKILAKLDWNVSQAHNLSFRYNFLDARRDLPPNATVLSFNGSGRGPNESSLPSQNSGYQINNELNSFALELNSRGSSWANRFFTSYNRFRDFRVANSAPFPTVEIGEGGVTYTTVGHEPFSIGNNLDQDIWQFQNDFTKFFGRHTLTLGGSFERYSFFNSFNIFRHGVFFLPAGIDFEGDGCPNTSTFASLDDFFAATDPANPNQFDFNCMVASGPFKGETIDLGQASVYLQDAWTVTSRLTLTGGLRVDLPIYYTDPVDNPFSRNLVTRDEDGVIRQSGGIDQSDLPGTSPLWSPRIGFNYALAEDRSTQIRGGTGIFTGRVPFVWAGNVISNPGTNPNLFAPTNPDVELIVTDGPRENSEGEPFVLQQTFDVNAMPDDFDWPQVWVSNFGIDHLLPGGVLGTAELIYGNDVNAIVMRNFDLVAPVGTNPIDGRPFYGGAGANELNPDGGAGIYVIDNSSDGWNVNVTAQLRKAFDFGLAVQGSYSYSDARNQLKSTEIASVLWQENPVQGDPNNPETSFSQFNQRHRIVVAGNWTKEWSDRFTTHFGLFFEVAEGNQHLVSGGNRFSFIYSGDVNGDGSGANDLIYIPRDESEIRLVDFTNSEGQVVTAAQQWTALDAFIEQDDYLNENRGRIAERFGLLNPWYQTLDMRILQDIKFPMGGRTSTIQLSLDVLNLTNLLNSSWGVRKVATTAATSPLRLVGFDEDGAPQLNFNMVEETFIDDPSISSRWQIQLGARYLFN